MPDELAGACQSVKDILTAERRILEASRSPLFNSPPWKAFTAVGKLISKLTHDTNPETFTSLAKLSSDEQSRLIRLRRDLSKDPAKAAMEQELKANNIQRLRVALKNIEQQIGDDVFKKLDQLYNIRQEKREAVKIAAEKLFSSESLEGVAGNTWRQLWESARRYSTEVAYQGKEFPNTLTGSVCVLCQQALSADAQIRMQVFEKFIKDDLEQKASEAERALAQAWKPIASLVLRIEFHRTGLQEVLLQNEDLAKRSSRSIAESRLRRMQCVKRFKSGEKIAISPASPIPLGELELLESNIRNYSIELKKTSIAEERKNLENELSELIDRENLGSHLSTIKGEINRLKELEFLSRCIGETSTNSITKLGNDIADTIITPKLRDRFQEEIIRLAAHKVRVEIVRSGGRFGSPHYQIRFFAKPDAIVSNILSEGEQTCVALAAFLTELATATHSSALIFDDPVCSLDHRWRKKVAERLVEESKVRQVIVFTHDLVFVNDLIDTACSKTLPYKSVTLVRGQEGTGVVNEGLPWKAKSVEDRIDRLKKSLKEARSLHDASQEEEYAAAAAALYNRLRATWERALEDIAFFRVVQRHRDFIETKNLKKVSALSDVDCDKFSSGFKKCCDIVDAHDASSSRNAAPPPPDEIEKDIEDLNLWVLSLRARQKLIN